MDLVTLNLSLELRECMNLHAGIRADIHNRGLQERLTRIGKVDPFHSVH